MKSKKKMIIVEKFGKITRVFVFFIVLFTPFISAASCSCKKIVDYMAVRQNFREDFDEQIRKLITKGWQPFGGVVYSRVSGSVQVMVKYEEDGI